MMAVIGNLHILYIIIIINYTRYVYVLYIYSPVLHQVGRAVDAPPESEFLYKLRYFSFDAADPEFL